MAPHAWTCNKHAPRFAPNVLISSSFAHAVARQAACSKYAIFFWRPELSKIALHKKQQVSKTHACMDGACMTWMQKGTRNAWTQKACTHVTARPCMNGNMCAWIREHPWYMNGQTQKRYAWMLCMLVSCAMGALPRRAVASFPRDNWPNYNACMSMKIMHGCLSTCKCQAIASRDWNHEHPPWLTPWACKRSEGMHAAMILITHVVFVCAAAHLPGDSQMQTSKHGFFEPCIQLLAFMHAFWAQMLDFGIKW